MQSFVKSPVFFALITLFALAARAEVPISTSAWLANEIESAHISVGRVKNLSPVWNIDMGLRFDHRDFGYLLVGNWTESDLTKMNRGPNGHEWWLHEIDPLVGYGYRFDFAEGFAFDTRVAAQWNYMRGYEGAARRSYDEWQVREELITPWVNVWYSMRNFYWPVAKASFRTGLRRSFPIWGGLSFEPNVWVDGGSARWNRQRFGYKDPNSIGSGVNSGSLQLFLNYRLNEHVSFYGGIIQYVVLDSAVHSELKADPSETSLTELTVATIGIRCSL